MSKALSLVALVIALPALAYADIPPPAGYVESCTAAIQQENGRRVCRECPSYHANPPGYCSEQVGPGFTLACRTRGASAWTEVWCKDAENPPPPAPNMDPAPASNPTPAPAPNANPAPAPATTAGRGRGCNAGHADDGAAALSLIAALAMLSVRRRR